MKNMWVVLTIFMLTAMAAGCSSARVNPSLMNIGDYSSTQLLNKFEQMKKLREQKHQELMRDVTGQK